MTTESQRVAEAWQQLCHTFIPQGGYVVNNNYQCSWYSCRQYAPYRERIHHKPDCPIGIVASVLHAAHETTEQAVMAWSREKPTVQGRYWYSKDPERFESIVIRFIGGRCINEEGVGMSPDHLFGWFCGPIIQPPFNGPLNAPGGKEMEDRK
jgi:hypothetical protein